MRIFLSVLCLLALGPFSVAKNPDFAPTEGQISDHRAKVFQVARDYIVETFNLIPIEECRFNPVRFNSTGVWGDFQTRIKDLGDHRFEVLGWINPEGHNNEPIEWSVVVKYELVDPEGWMYRRVDEVFSNEAEVTSWKFNKFWSVPYEADYTAGLLAEYNKR